LPEILWPSCGISGPKPSLKYVLLYKTLRTPRICSPSAKSGTYAGSLRPFEEVKNWFYNNIKTAIFMLILWWMYNGLFQCRSRYEDWAVSY
jgi:hypothetical protein